MTTIFARAVAVSEKIEHSAASVFDKIFGANALTSLEDDIKPLFEEDVIKIFSDAVNAAETLTVPVEGSEPASTVPASSAQKKEAAFAQIAKDLVSAGKSLGENVINFGIELVVGLVKSKTPVAA